MPKAHKLPSGSWNCIVFEGYEEEILRDGTIKKKRRYKSFTNDDPTKNGKRECERAAAEWACSREIKQDTTVRNMIDNYIQAKQNVLSPSTIRGYKANQRQAYKDIDLLDISDLSPTVVQIWVNSVSKDNTPKTVRNKYALLNAAYQMATGRQITGVTLPAKKQTDLYTPTDDDIRKLINAIPDTKQGQELKIAVMLAAFCSLREGEICALDSSNVVDGRLYVRSNMVLDSSGAKIIKQPKTESSYRVIDLPPFLYDMIKDIDGPLVPCSPHALYDRFRVVRDRVFGGPVFRFHDLRHYYASITHAIGVPDEYIMATGGWKTDYVMKRVYRDALPDIQQTESLRIASHFEALQNKMQNAQPACSIKQ